MNTTRPQVEAQSRFDVTPRHYPLPRAVRMHGEPTEERRRPHQSDVWVPSGGTQIAVASGANIIAAILANAGFATTERKLYGDDSAMRPRVEGRVLTALRAEIVASVEEDVSGSYVYNPELSRQVERLLGRVEVRFHRDASSTSTLEGIPLYELLRGEQLPDWLHQLACDKEFRAVLVHPESAKVPKLTPQVATRTWVEIRLTATFEDRPDMEGVLAVDEDDDAPMEPGFTADLDDDEGAPAIPQLQRIPGLSLTPKTAPDLQRLPKATPQVPEFNRDILNVKRPQPASTLELSEEGKSKFGAVGEDGQGFRVGGVTIKNPFKR